MVKLLENTFRAVNIGLVNEIALMCDTLGIDVWEVVDAAKTKPFGFMPFYPGPGLGGHCIPIDPFYLSWKAKQSGFEARFIELAGHVNGAMPHCVVDKIADALNTQRKAVNGSRILVAGHRLQARHRRHARVAGARRHGPAARAGARLSYVDPFVPVLRAGRLAGRLRADARRSPTPPHGADCVAILTDHSVFDYALVAAAPLVVDTRNATRARTRTCSGSGAPAPTARGRHSRSRVSKSWH